MVVSEVRFKKRHKSYDRSMSLGWRPPRSHGSCFRASVGLPQRGTIRANFLTLFGVIH